MSIITFPINNIYGDREIWYVWLPHGTDLPEPPEIVSRGLAGNAGNGPYFRARGTTQLWQGDTCLTDLPSEYRWNDGYYDHHYFVEVESPSVFYFCHYWYAGSELTNYVSQRIRCEMWPTAQPYRCTLHYTLYVKRPGEWRMQSDTSYSVTGVDTDVRGCLPPESEYMKHYDDFMYNICTGGIRHMSYFAAAYLEAANSLPQADVNLIGNIKEAVEYVHSAVEAIKDPASALSGLVESLNPKDLWLQYRYVYKTNQMDARELQELVGQLDYLAELPHSTIKCKGQHQVDAVKYGVSMRFPLETILPDDLMSYLSMFGLNVTPSNIWDLIPYSFMVDWFAQIGDKLKYFEDWIGAVELQPRNIWFTVREHMEHCDVYYRVPGHKPVVPPLYTQKVASGKTVMMRVADTIAIFT